MRLTIVAFALLSLLLATPAIAQTATRPAGGGKSNAAPGDSKKTNTPNDGRRQTGKAASGANLRDEAAKSTSQPSTGRAPVALDPPDSIGRRLNELQRLKNRRLNDKEIALRAALEFLVAVGAGDGESAARVTEAVGYQPLPLGEKLPNPPAAGIGLDSLRAQVAARRPAPIRELPIGCIQLVQRDELQSLAPAISRWMLPDDWAIVIADATEADGGNESTPHHDAPAASPGRVFPEPAVLVVRLRAGRATVMGGNMLAALR
ncbi:MAG: hypothetical protein JNG88_10520 [Phycisphaerales bacterium]|nr:hypothetical protein [Phycisphaerales bacterium]